MVKDRDGTVRIGEKDILKMVEAFHAEETKRKCKLRNTKNSKPEI